MLSFLCISWGSSCLCGVGNQRLALSSECDTGPWCLCAFIHCLRKQVWLALHNLLADGQARAKMDMTEGRCEALLRLKRHFNELLLDQASEAGRGRAGQLVCHGLCQASMSAGPGVCGGCNWLDRGPGQRCTCG